MASTDLAENKHAEKESSDQVTDSDCARIKPQDDKEDDVFDLLPKVINEDICLPRVSQMNCSGIIRDLFCLSDGKVVVDLGNQIQIYSREYDLMFEIDGPPKGRVTSTERNQLAILCKQTIEIVEILDKEDPKYLNFINVCYEGSPSSFTYGGEVFAVATEGVDTVPVYIFSTAGKLLFIVKPDISSLLVFWPNQTFHCFEHMKISRRRIHASIQPKFVLESSKLIYFSFYDEQLYYVTTCSKITSFCIQGKHIIYIEERNVDDHIVTSLVVQTLKAKEYKRQNILLDRTPGYVTYGSLGAIAYQAPLKRVLWAKDRIVEVFTLNQTKI